MKRDYQNMQGKKAMPERQTIFELQAAPNLNEHIASHLINLAKICKNQGLKHKFTAYTTAAHSLSMVPKKIEREADIPQELEGVGVSIRKKILEIVATGRLAELDALLQDPNIATLNLISQVTGIGPKSARAFMQQGVTSLEQLKQQKLTHIQALGLQYLADFGQRAPRDEVKALYKHVREAAAEIDAEIILRCCGSYRRKCADCGDIDILISHPKFTNAHLQQLKNGAASQAKKSQAKNKKNAQDDESEFGVNDFSVGLYEGADPLLCIMARLVASLKKRKFLVDDLFQGSLQYSGVCRLPKEETANDTMAVESKETKSVARKIDIKIFPIESFHTGLLTYTGSGEFIRQLCTRALNKGFKLNEYHLVPVGLTEVEGEPIAVASEQDIFEMLGVAYREPRLRSFGGTHLNKNRNIYLRLIPSFLHSFIPSFLPFPFLLTFPI